MKFQRRWQDLQEELETHRRLAAADQRKLPPLESAAEATARQWRFTWFRDGLRDLRYAVQQLYRQPLLSLAVIMSLGLGIGANTVIFTYANAMLLRMPAVSNPKTLAEVYEFDPDPNASNDGYFLLSYPDYKDFRARTRAFSDIALINVLAQVSMSHNQTRNHWGGSLVTANFFDVLGLHPALGRFILPEEAQTPGSSAVLVLGYRAWQRDFGGNPGVLGQKILINQVPFLVVGVAPANFPSLYTGFKTDFWAPITMADSAGQPGLLVRDMFSNFGIGRLRPGQTLASASADLVRIHKQLAEDHPKEDNSRWSALAAPIGSEPAFVRRYVSGANVLLMCVVGAVLLIACFNAANLLLVQAQRSRREWALRSALGASRGRLLRQGLTQSTLLAGLAGVAGLMAAYAIAPAMLRLTPPGVEVEANLAPDWRVLTFTLGLALATGVVFGLLPAWRAANNDALTGLKQGGAGASGSGQRLRQVMVVSQVAVCALVLIGTGLCLRSLQQAAQIRTGLDLDHLIEAEVDPLSLGYHNAAARGYLERLEDNLDRLPGVRATASIASMPLDPNMTMQLEVLAPGMQPPPGHLGVLVDVGDVGPKYFAASGTALVAGRDFTRADLPSLSSQTGPLPTMPDQPDLVVVNQALADRFWPHQDPVGRDLLFPTPDHVKHARVIGVAANGKYRSLGEPTRMYVYALAQVQTGAVLVRVAGSASSALNTVRARLMALDPNLIEANVLTGADSIKLFLFPARASSVMLGGFGFLAFVLAVLGLYAVIAASVAQRTREFGIRMALGAAPGRVLGEVMRQGVRLVGIGLAIGLALAAVIGRLIAGLLYGVSPLDPLAYISAAVLLAAVALAAAGLPAWRASMVDPTVTLRCE